MADQKLIEALRLLAERPEILEAALAIAQKAPAPAQVVQTVGELWDGWVPWGEANIKSWRVCENSHSALKRTKLVLDDGRETTLLELPWDECTPHAADKYRAARMKMKNGRGGTISPVTIDSELGRLQIMFNYWRDIRKTIPQNPIDGFHRVDSEQYARKTSLTPEQVRAFLDCAPPIFQDICWVLYRCAGMRHSEGRLLKKSEIDWAKKTINLPPARNKNRRPRVIPFPEDVEVILRRHSDLSLGPLVFVHPRDPKRKAEVPQGSMHQWLKKAREKSGITGFDGEAVVIHTLRHSGVTQLVSDGAPEGWVKKAAGMSDKTFRRYNQFNEAQQDALRGIMNRSIDPPVPHSKPLADGRKAPVSHAPLTMVPKAKAGDE